MPAVSVIRSWVSAINSKSGKNKELLKQLKLKLEATCESEREFERQDDRPGLEYNLKYYYIEGYHDLSDDFGGKEPRLVTSVLVLLPPRGIFEIVIF